MAGRTSRRRLAQPVLCPSPTLSEDILEAIQTLVVVINGRGDAVYISPSIRRILGYDVSETISEKYFETVQSPDGVEDRLAMQAELARAAKGEISVPEPYTTRLLTKSGEMRWILWHDSKGPGDLLIEAGQDITALRRAEEELDRRQKDFRAIFEASSEGLLITDSSWTYLAANPSACRISGLTPDQIVGVEHGCLLESDVNAREVREMAVTDGGVTAEAELHRPDGSSRHVEYSIVPFFQADQHLIILRDITERSALELQLAQAQRLEAIGRLAGGVAHDFNNMLTAIQGYGDLLLKQYPDGSFRRYVQGILAATERAAQTTHQLLAFSRRQLLQPKLLPINQAISDTIDLLRRLIGEDIELATILAPDAGSILVDPGQFSQVLMNLAVNSRDAMPDGGRLLIETRRVQLDDEYVLKHVQVRAGTYVMLAVSDTGVGIPKDVREHIFEPFFTTKPQGQGSGLGLSTVYGIVKQSGGYVWAYSEPGEGSTFKLYFPQAVPDKDSEDAPTSTPINILLIEDDESIRSLAASVLREQGHQVIEVSDGGAALHACQEFEGMLDLMITDVTAPGMSGEDLSGFFAVKYPNAAILHMSGFPQAQLTRAHGIPSNAYFLTKPFTVKQLLETMQAVLENRKRPRPC